MVEKGQPTVGLRDMEYSGTSLLWTVWNRPK